MEIFGMGPGEMLLIMVLALIIVGPQKLPEIGRNLGRTLAEFKAQTDALRSVMTFDVPAAEGAHHSVPPSPRPAPVSRATTPLGPLPGAALAALTPDALSSVTKE